MLCPGEPIREQDGCYPVRCGGHRRPAEVLGSGIAQAQVSTPNACLILALGNKLQINLLFIEVLLFFFFPIFANDRKSGLEKNQPYWLGLEVSKSILKIHYSP